MEIDFDSDSQGGARQFPNADLPQPFSSLVNVDVSAISHQGHVRTNNEDHYLVVRAGRALETILSNLTVNQPGDLFEEKAFGMVVADGVGGHEAGEIASRQAIYTLLSLVLHTPDWHFRWKVKEENLTISRMKERFEHINSTLIHAAASQACLAGMSTTLTVGVSYGKSLIIAHVGDSRAYVLHDRKLARLTRDHTLAQRLIDDGVIAEDDDLARSLRSVLTQALGSREGECYPDVRHHNLEEGDQLLLCTDGLTDMVDEAVIESVLNEGASARAACRSLVDTALNNGGRDNVTVIVARYAFPPEVV